MLEYGTLFVYVFFMLLLAWWGRRIGIGELPFLTKLVVISGLFVFFALGGDMWQDLWGLLWPQWALAGGFLLGLSSRWLPRISFPRSLAKQRSKPSQLNTDQHQREQAAYTTGRRDQRASSPSPSPSPSPVNEERIRAELEKEREAQERAANERIKRAEQRTKEAQRAQQRAEAEAAAAKAAPEFDPHEILGVEKTASPAEIKATYRKLVAQYHPDKAPGTTEEIRKLAEEKFKDIQRAYTAIG